MGNPNPYLLTMPTLIGTTPKWGIEQDEAGIIIDGIDYDFKTKEQESMDKVGEPRGLVLYGDTCDTSVKGEIPVTSPSALRLAATLTMANATPDHFISALSGGRNVTKGIKIGKQREGFQKFDANGTLYPMIPAS